MTAAPVLFPARHLRDAELTANRDAGKIGENAEKEKIMDTGRLVIVEGLPASGKSTAASRIAAMLEDRGNRVICWDEGVPGHPADYDNYDFPDFETEREKILGKWRQFVQTAKEDTTYVFNCIFLQNPMCETMMRFDLTEEESCAYICEIAEIIRPMNPRILYLNQENVKTAVDGVLQERGDGWLNAVLGYHVDQGYGRRLGLSGYDGYLACLEERRSRELRILEQTGLDHHILNARPSEAELAGVMELLRTPVGKNAK